MNFSGSSGCFTSNNNNNIVTTSPQWSGSIVSLTNLVVISANNNGRQTNKRLSDIEPEIEFKNVTDQVTELKFKMVVSHNYINFLAYIAN